MEKLYDPIEKPSVDVSDSDWYKQADAVYNAHMADFVAPGQLGGYNQYVLESRRYQSNLDPLQTMGYLHAQEVIDSKWDYFKSLGKSVYNGGIGVVRDTLNGIRAARDYNIALLNEQAKAQGFERNPDQDFINALDNAAKADVLKPYEVKQSASNLGQFGLDVAQGAGQLVGQMAGTIATEAVLPGVGGMALMVGQITGGQYEDLKEKGVDTKRAAEAAFANAMIQAPFERLSLGRLMRKVPAGSVLKKKLKMVWEDAMTEGITEAIQQFPEEWAELWALNPDKSWKELQQVAAKKFPDTLQNALYAGLIGAVLGAGSRGIHIALDRNLNLALRKELHDETIGAIENRINSIKQSRINPDYAAETINANLNNATVLIDGDVLNAYAQRVGEEKAAEKLGVSMETIREAAEKGDTVEVNQGNFEALAASDDSFYQEVKDDISFDAQDMSNRKYETIQANIARYSKLGEGQRKELKTEVDKIAKTMEEAGAAKGQIAGMKAMLASFATAMRPDNPAQFLRDNALRFERGVTRMSAPVDFSGNEEKANLVKDILNTNFDNPREEVENRLKTIDEEIKNTPEGSENLPILKGHRDILTSLLNSSDEGVPAIENYKQRYNRDNGTFDNTYHQSGQNKMSALVINPNKQRTTDSLLNYEKLSIDNIKKRDPEAFDKIITKVNKIPGLGVKDATNEEKYQHMKKRVAANLVWLYELVTDPEDRKRAKLWYEGGHKMIKSWADRYGISEMAGAGAMAVLSPQKDWFMNVNMTERILDIMFADRFKPWTQEMTEIARLGKLKKDGTREDPIVTPQKRGVDPNMPALDRAEGKTLDELLRNRDYYAAAVWIRVYDEVYNSEEKFGENNRGYKILTPEGGTGDYVKTQDDKKANMAWQGYGNIAKAVSIIANPSYTNVSLQLGTNHKVRNFFNNLYNPNELDFATIDTHAVAAAALMPYSASSEAVNENFGTLSSADSGASGTYAFFLEAYRDAADEVGISAREMQSITWEMVRILFTDTFKKDVKLKDENGNYILDEDKKPITGPNENVLAIQKAWEDADKAINEYDGPDKEANEKKILEKTRKNVYNIVDKVKPVGKFAWHDTAFQPEVGDTYNRSRVHLINDVGVDNKQSRTQISVEVAPDPNNKELSRLWYDPNLSDADREQISKEVANLIINLVLDEFDSDAVFSVQVGGYEGKTNPSLNISVDKPELAVPIAKMLGYALNQDSMFITSYAPFMGAQKSKGVAINVGAMGIEGARQLYDKLYTITNKAGNPAVTGYSLSDEVVTIIFDEESNGMTVDELIDKIVEVTPEYDNEIRSVEVYMAAPQRVRTNADTDIYGYLPPLPKMETQKDLKEKAREIVADRKARGIKATIGGVTEELIKEQEDRLKAVKQQWVDILLPAIEKVNKTELAQKGKDLAVKEGISYEDALKRVEKEEEDAIAKRNKEREEMLNAKSITERVDWSVATLDRRADYIRSQADAAIQRGISEARGQTDEASGSTGADAGRSQVEGAVPAGSGQLLGQETPGTGTPGRVEFNQAAYHGTGARFEEFNTDFMGTGEGAQVHGWGLYFAQDRNVAKGYKEKLQKWGVEAYLFSVGGKELDQKTQNILRNNLGINSIGMAAEGNDSQLKDDIRRFIKRLEEGDKFSNQLIKVLQEEIDRIDSNPKMSIAAFLESVPADEKYRFKTIVEIARKNAKNENRRASIADVKAGIERHLQPHANIRENDIKLAKELKSIDIDNLKVTKNTGTLFEVDIPENDVLLDEQKTFKDQDKNVQKLIENAFNDLTGEQRTKFVSKLFEEKNQRWWYSKEFDDARDAYENERGKLNSLKTLSGKTWYKRTPQNLRNRFKEILTEYGYSEDRATTLVQDYQAAQQEYEKLQKETNLEKLKNERDALLARDEANRDKAIANANIAELLQDKNGKYIYKSLAEVLGDRYADKRAASLFLNEHGIKGITYDGFRDGRCFVVFDDKAIDILDRYYQRQQEATQVKGSFDPFTEGEAVIKLFEGADASTVIHETGHYYIESMWREIAAGRATEQQKADFEKLMKYCGITTRQWANMDTEDRRAAHERLAEAIETYVMEDKAPTRELRPVFKRFAKWLKAVYSAISRNRNAVPLTDEVREVFDRMLASEEDVEEMRRVEGYFEKLPSVITDNLSDATKKRIEDYILKAQDKAVEILTKERLANFSEDRKREIENYRNIISDEVRQEVANRPLYVAARQAQELFGGEKPASAKAYANQYLEEKMSDADEVKWEIVAEQNNMSPMEMAQKLLEEPNENEAYKAAMDEAVRKEYPDYYTEREQAEAATREAMYNDESGILLGVEQVLITDYAAKAFGRQTVQDAKKKVKEEEKKKAKEQTVEMPKRSAEMTRRMAMAKRQQAKVAAQKELANMKMKDAIRVDRFIAAERRCAVKSAEAMAKGDYETARKYKDMQAFNHACVIESANLRKRKQQYDKFLRKQLKAKRESWTTEQHFNQAMALFARMGLPTRKEYDPTTKTQSLTEYLAEMAEWYYSFGEIPEWLADDTWPITDPKNMRFEDYEKVVDLMEYIKTMAKAEKADNFFDTQKNYQEWRDNAIDNLNKLATKFAPVLGEKQTATLKEKFDSAYQTLDNFLEKMDGWHFGFFSRSFGDAIKHANDREFELNEAYNKRISEAEKAWCPTKEALEAAAEKVYYEELGTSASKFVLTKMLMNLGNEGNARKLCGTLPSEDLRNSSLWVFPSAYMTKDEAIEQTKENLLEFLGRVLTKEDIAYAQAKIDAQGMYWGERAELDRRTKGFTPKKVEAYPVTLTLANGETVVFRGGYFPLIRNGEMGSHPAGILPVSDTDPDQGRNVRTMYTDMGRSISRVEASYPVDLAEGSEDRAMRNAIHDLCWRETMTGFRRILNDQAMFGLMKSKLGIADMASFREMLEHAAQPNGGASMAMGEGLLATTFGWLRRKTVNSIVMLNLRINLQNFGNFFLYGNAVEGFGYSDVLAAMGNAFNNGFEGKSFSEMWKFVDEKSAFMRSRSESPDITLAELREEGKLNKYERKATDWGAKAMMYTDGLTARPVWVQAYYKKLNQGSTEQEAIDFADTIVRRTLGSGRVTDVSSLQRGGPIFKLFTAFQGFFNTQFNQWMREYNIDKRLLAEGNTSEAVQRITAFVASKYLAACLFNLVFALESPFEDDDDEYMNYTKELMHYPMSLVGIFGSAANFAMDKALGMKAYSYRMSIIESSLDKVFRASGKLGKMIEGDFESGLEGLSDVAGIYAGVPAQMNRLFWNAYDIFINGMEPEMRDLATRRPKRERK